MCDHNRTMNAARPQPYTVQIIQLDECAPPPRQPIVNMASSSRYSSSACSDDESDEEEEEYCSSYCSSEEQQEPEPEELFELPHSPSSYDTHPLRMKRILSWRENFSALLSASLMEDSTISSTLKRKFQCHNDDDDYDSMMSRTSKRSRSQASSQGGHSADSSLGALSCPACDTSFDDASSLRQHGRAKGANEACFAAVEYAFE